MAITPVVLYGFDEKDMNKYLAIDEILTKPGILQATLDITGNYAEPGIESELIEYADNSKRTIKKSEYKLNLELKKKRYNDAENFEDFYSPNVLLKRTLFLDLKDYKLKPSDYPADSAMQVYLTTYSVEHDAATGTKSIKIGLTAK